MAIGYACICLGDHKRMKGLRLADASEDKLDSVCSHNLDVLESNIRYNIRNGISLFRISSDIFPLMTHEDVSFSWEKRYQARLDGMRELISGSNMRVSMHPGQYTVINSSDPAVQRRAVKEIDYHSELLSRLTCDDKAPVIVHAASGGDPRAAGERFRHGFSMLSGNSRKRLCVENDERAFSAKSVYQLAVETGIPAVYDNLHNKINPSYDLSDREIIDIFSGTFGSRKQKIHYSQQDQLKREGAHSMTTGHREFTGFYRHSNADRMDIMLEVKDKDLSCIKCMNCTGEKAGPGFEEWARYKYFVMERDISAYHRISGMFSEGSFTYAGFYDIIENLIGKKASKENAVNALLHVWGYFKRYAGEDEKRKFFDRLRRFQDGRMRITAVKRHLLSLAVKYDTRYLLDSMYFISDIYD